MAFRALIVGSGFGSRVVAGCYEEAGMQVEVVTPRDPASVRSAIAQPFDLISIHSPPFLHAEHVNMALDHGHHVLCDKPFGTSAKEAQQMLDRARDKGVVHLLNFEFRCDPGRARVKEIIDSGEIGRVTHINWTFFNGFSRFPMRKHGWQFEADKGGGWIRINATHMLDAIRWLVGEITEVDVHGRIDLKDRPDKDGKIHTGDAEDGFSAYLKTATGATVNIDTAWAVPGTMPDHWTVIGTEGMIDIVERIELYIKPLVRDTDIKVWRNGGKPRDEHLGPFEGDGHLPAMRPWSKIVRDAVTERRQIRPSFEDGVAASKVIDMMRASMSANGK